MSFRIFLHVQSMVMWKMLTWVGLDIPIGNCKYRFVVPKCPKKYFDCRFAGLAKPRVALIISVVCMLSALGLSGYYMTGSVYQKSTRKCGYGTGNRGAVSWILCQNSHNALFDRNSKSNAHLTFFTDYFEVVWLTIIRNIDIYNTCIMQFYKFWSI